MTDSSQPLTHLDGEGKARMVDVTGKDVTARSATARGAIVMSPGAFEAVRDGSGPKGDVLGVARLAGIMAGKRTGELIPLCHMLPGTSVSVDLALDPDLPGVIATAEARAADRTGVEMEALVAVSLALLTVYDMVKAVDRGMVVQDVRLVSKSGGKSGSWESDHV